MEIELNIIRDECDATFTSIWTSNSDIVGNKRERLKLHDGNQASGVVLG